MSGESRTALQRRLAAEFQRRDWDYDLETVLALMNHVERSGQVVPRALAERLPGDFLRRNAATRDDVAEAIARAIGGRALAPAQPVAPTSIVITDNRGAVMLGAGARMRGGNINTGTTLTIGGDSDKQDVLKAVAVLVRQGLDRQWDAEGAALLAQLVDSRSDIALEDVRGAAAEAAEGAELGRIRALLTDISTTALGGALSTGIVLALGQLF